MSALITDGNTCNSPATRTLLQTAYVAEQVEGRKRWPNTDWIRANKFHLIVNNARRQSPPTSIQSLSKIDIDQTEALVLHNSNFASRPFFEKVRPTRHNCRQPWHVPIPFNATNKTDVEGERHRINAKVHAVTAPMLSTSSPGDSCKNKASAIMWVVHEKRLPVDGYVYKSATIEKILRYQNIFPN